MGRINMRQIMSSERYLSLKETLEDRIIIFNVRLKSVNQSPSKNGNEIVAFTYADEYKKATNNAGRAKAILAFLRMNWMIFGPDMELLIKNSIFSYMKDGIRFDSFPVEKLSRKRNSFIVHVDEMNELNMGNWKDRISIFHLECAGLEKRICEVLVGNGITTIGMLDKKEEMSLKKLKGISVGSIRKIQNAIVEYNQV